MVSSADCLKSFCLLINFVIPDIAKEINALTAIVIAAFRAAVAIFKPIVSAFVRTNAFLYPPCDTFALFTTTPFFFVTSADSVVLII